MKYLKITALLAGVTLLAMLSTLALADKGKGKGPKSQELRFEATLSGAQEPVPAGGVVTDTTGRIRVEFNEALSEAAFRLIVRDGVGVTQAHFHCERPGLNGPVVIFLFPFTPGGVNVDGELAEGTLTNAGFLAAGTMVCPGLIGRPVNNIAALAFAMRDGLIYANVHTVANPGGEVRGQLLE